MIEPRRSASAIRGLTDDQIIGCLAQLGARRGLSPISLRDLRRWCRGGLLHSRFRRGRGRGSGAEWRWPAINVRRALLLARWEAAGEHKADVLRLRLRMHGRELPDAQMVDDLESVFGRANRHTDRSLARASRRRDRSQPWRKPHERAVAAFLDTEVPQRMTENDTPAEARSLYEQLRADPRVREGLTVFAAAMTSDEDEPRMFGTHIRRLAHVAGLPPEGVDRTVLPALRWTLGVLQPREVGCVHPLFTAIELVRPQALADAFLLAGALSRIVDQFTAELWVEWESAAPGARLSAPGLPAITEVLAGLRGILAGSDDIGGIPLFLSIEQARPGTLTNLREVADARRRGSPVLPLLLDLFPRVLHGILPAATAAS